MANPDNPAPRDSISAHLYEVDTSDPQSKLVDRSSLSAPEIAQISTLMKSLSALREMEQAVSDASQKYMKLSAQEMRALHYLIVAKNLDELVKPGMLSEHLKISKASTTKLLNRLESGGHIVRHVHPVDRRAFSIAITPESEASAMDTVGRHQAQRFYAAAHLSVEERDTVIRFLDEMRHGMSLDHVGWAK